MLIAARFSGSGSGKNLLSRAISLIASGLLPFSSFPIPVAPDSYRGRRERGLTMNTNNNVAGSCGQSPTSINPSPLLISPFLWVVALEEASHTAVV